MTLFEQEFQKYQWITYDYPSTIGVRHLKNHPNIKIPNSYGTYIIRAPEPLNRVHLQSNVVYIGQSGGTERRGKQGIYGRPLVAPRGVEERIRNKIEALFPEQNFQLQYFVTAPDGQLAKQIEGDLLQAYLLTHFELPPANNQCPNDFKFS